MTGNRRLGHACHLQCGGASTTERVAGVVRWRLMKAVSHPAAHVTNEGDVGERSCAGAVVEEVRRAYAAEAGRQEPCVCAVCGDRAEAVVASNDGHCRWDKCRLGEGDGQTDAPRVDRDVLAEQAGAGVLLDAEEAEEGKQRCTPVAGVGEDAEVDVGSYGAQVVEGEAAGGLAEVGVAVPVEQAGLDAVEGAAARKVGEAHAHGVVGDGGDEAGQAGDAVPVGVDDADAAQLELCERGCGVDAHGGADGAEGALARLVRESRVESEGVAGEAVDELT